MAEEGEQRKLGLFGATSLTLVALIGTGMFFGPAISAQYAGPAAIISWIILGLISIYMGFIFAELVSLFPTAGGVYEFAKQAYGRFASFFLGWIMWLVATINTSILIVGALLYAFPFLPFGQMIIASLLLVIVLHAVALRGVGASSFLLDIFAGSLVVFILITIFGGIGHTSLSNYIPFFLSEPSVSLGGLLSANVLLELDFPLRIALFLFITLFFILETYFGWEAACFLAEETKNPRTTIPRALILSTFIASFLGWALLGVLFGIFPAEKLAQSATPLIDVFSLLFGSGGEFILKAGVFLSLIGSAAGNIISGPRLLMAMARDKVFIEQLSVSTNGVPRRAIIFQAIASTFVLFIALGAYKTLLAIIVPLALFIYIPTIIALPILRIKQPGERAYSCPFPFVGPILIALLYLAALVAWLLVDPSAWSILKFILSLMVFGLPIYLLLSVYYNPSTQLFFSDALAWPAKFLEPFVMPKYIRRKILATAKNLQGKEVLEYGAGVGTLSVDLSRAVGSSGKVFAIESGKNNFSILSSRAKSFSNIVPLQDPFSTSRVHPDVEPVDAIFSTGMLGYVQDWQKVLKELAVLLPDHGQVCFMEWVDYFGFLPNPSWLSNSKQLVKDFQEAGFAVRIERVQGLFWNYMLVYGVKSDEPISYV